MTRSGSSRTRWRGWPAGLLVAVLAAGCSGSSPSSGGASPSESSGTTPDSTTSSTTGGPPAPAAAPDTGTCRRLDYGAISHYSNADPTVACTSPHTSYTFAVRRIPAAVSVPGVSIGNKSIQDAASSSCRDAFAAFIGGTPAVRALSRLSVTYFLPEQRDFNRGAHWVRCDVVALKTFNQLAALPRQLDGFLDTKSALHSYGVCSQGEPGAASSRLVMCAGPHTYRALTALRLGAEADGYPGRQAAGPDGQQRCSTFIADRLGTTAGYTFGWTYPTPADWTSGQRFGYCWLKSTK